MRDGSWTGSGRNSMGRHPLGLPALLRNAPAEPKACLRSGLSLARAGYGIILSVFAGTIPSIHPPGLRRWDYPIGSASTGAWDMGLSYQFREGNRLEPASESPAGVHPITKYGTILSVSRLTTHAAGVGLSYRIRRDYPIGSSSCVLTVWDYPIGFTGTIRLIAWDYPIGFHGLSYCRVRPDRCRQ